MSSTAVPYALDSYAKALLGPIWAEFGLALLLLLARVYTSWRITELIKLDLYLAILTFALASVSLAFFTLAVCYGLGQHIDLLSVGQQIHAMKWSWCFTSVSLFAISIGKLTVIAFLQQLHGPHSRNRAIFLWALGASNLIVNAVTVAMALTTCSPMQALWDVRIHVVCSGVLRNEYCAYFQGSWNAMADLILAFYPVTLLYRLQLSRALKIGLCILMGLGVVAGACAIVKTIKLQYLSETRDTTYYVGQLNFWNGTEMWVVLIVACIPPIRKLLANMLGKVHSEIASKTGTFHHTAIELRSSGHRDQRPTSNAPKRQRDNESEENILGGLDIRKTTNIDVEYWRTNASLERFERHDPVKGM